jgi:hypothetical protein
MHNLLAGEPISPATRDRRDHLAHKLDAEYASRSYTMAMAVPEDSTEFLITPEDPQSS